MYRRRLSERPLDVVTSSFSIFSNSWLRSSMALNHSWLFHLRMSLSLRVVLTRLVERGLPDDVLRDHLRQQVQAQVVVHHQVVQDFG